MVSVWIISKEEKNRRLTTKCGTVGCKERRKEQAPTLDRQTHLFECEQAIVDKVIRAKELRKQGMTQKDIAEMLGVTQRAVCPYLKNK